MKTLDTRFKAAMIGGSAFILVVSFALQGCELFAQKLGEALRKAYNYEKEKEYRAQARAINRPPPHEPTTEAITVDKLPLAIAFGNLSSQWDKDKFDHAAAAQTEHFDNFSDFLLDQRGKATPQEVKNVRTQLENEGFKFQVCDQNRWCAWETK
jgi:hypothetical protein